MNILLLFPLFIIVITIIICFLIKYSISSQDLSYEDLLKIEEWSEKRQKIQDLSYEDLLKTEEWREKRQKILNRDNNKCVYCGKTHNLQVHHKYYSKYPNGFRVYPWNYPDDALITLCDECHKKVHSKKKIKNYYRSYSDNY